MREVLGRTERATAVAQAPQAPAEEVVPRRRPAQALVGVVLEVIAVLACGVLPLSRGEDVSFDLLNYHYFYPWLIWHGGIGQVDPEPFTNRYVNPLAQLPWYALERFLAPLPATFAIAMVAGLNLVLVRRITLRLLPASVSGWWAVVLSCVSMVLAGTGVVFRTELGMSLADVIVSIPMLGALLLVLRAVAAQRPALTCALAGVLSGVAVGAKLTMATYTLALGLSVVYLAVRQRNAVLVLTHAVGVVVGVAASAGWWFWEVWRATGNPVFPYYNGIFHSQYWGTNNLRDARFGPHGILDALQYPLYMAQGTRRLLDVPLKDPRWLLLCGLLALALVAGVARATVRRRAQQPQPALADNRSVDATHRTAVGILALFFVTSSVAWLVQFGIARYAVTSELLVGPVLVLCLLWLLRRPVAVVLAGTLLAVGMVPLINVGPYLHRPFAPTRFEVQAAPLQAVPKGSVVISDAGSAPSSFLLTYLPDGVRRHVIHPWFYDTPLLDRLKREELAVAPHIYLIEGYSGVTPAGVERVRQHLGLQLNVADCVPVRTIVQLRKLCPATWVGAGT